MAPATFTTVASGDWLSDATWSGSGTPGAADTVTINGGYNVSIANGASVAAATVNVGGTTTGTGAGTLTFGGSTSVLTVSGNFTLGQSTFRTGTLVMTNGGTLHVAGTLTFNNPGSESFFTPGTGTIDYNGANQTVGVANNSYNNLTLSGSGTKTAGGNLTVAGTLAIADNVTFNMNNNDTSVGGLSSSGTGSGTVVRTSAGTSTLTINGSTTQTFAGVISSDNTTNVIKSGTGTQIFSGANTYDGTTTVGGGVLQIANATAGTGTVTINNNGVFEINNVTHNTPITLNSGGTLRGIGASARENGTITVANAGVTIGTGSTTTDVLTLGNAGNDLTGGGASATINVTGSGTLTQTQSSNLTAGTKWSVGSGATLSISNDNQLGTAPGGATAGIITLNGGTLATTADFTLDANRGIAVGSSVGTTNVANGTTLTYNGIIANVAAQTGALTKTGAGTFTLSGSSANTFTGTTTVNAGNLQLNKTAGQNAIGGNLIIGDGSGTDTVTLQASNQLPDDKAVTLNTGGALALGTNSDTIGTLQGTGSVTTSGAGTLTVATNLSPGSSPDIITTGNLTLTGGTTYNVDINGTTAGSGYDQVQVTGTATLGGATLNVTSSGLSDSAGSAFDIITATSVSGTFANGPTFTANGIIFTLSYTGTTVTLTHTAPSILSVDGPLPDSYREGQYLDFTVNYDTPVNVIGSHVINLTIGSTSRNATYLSGNGTSALVFRYIVQAGDTDIDGIESASPIILSGGTIKDGAGLDAGLTFTPPDTTGVLVDTTAPNAPSITSVTDDEPPLTSPLTSGDSTDDTDLTVRVSLTGTGAVAGDTVQLYDGTGTANQLGSSYTLTLTDIGNTYADVQTGTLTDGLTYTITARVTDAVGNQSVVSTNSFTVTIDTTATIAIDDPLAGDNFVNPGEAASFVVSGTTVGVEDGQTVSITLSDSTNPDVTASATVTGGVWTTTANISGLDDGTITITADVSDQVGNADSDGTTVTLDQTAPDIFIDGTLAGDNVVNAVEALNFVVSGTTNGVEDGQTVDITLSDGPTTLTTTATVTGNVWSATVDISSLDDGTITITADVSDLAGNPATQAGTTVTLDQTASIAIDVPLAVDNIVNAVEALTFGGTGTTNGVEDDQTVYITLTDGSNTLNTTATVTGGVWTVSGDISSLDDGTITITADVSDLAGNLASASTTVTLDQTASIAIDDPLAGDNFVNAAEAASFVVSGTTVGVDDDQTVTVTLNDGDTTVTTTATVSGNVWSATVDISGLLDGSITITADVSDLAGNPATQASTTVTLDQTAPTIAIDLLDALVSATEAPSFVVSGTTDGVEDGRTVDITLSHGATTVTATATVTGNAWITTADISGLADGTIAITADVSDLAGNPATQASTTVILDQTAPTITIGTLDALVNAVEASSFVVSGTNSGVENGQTISITLSDGATLLTASTTVAGGIWTTTVDISSLADGPITITADVSDFAGNPATQASTTVTLDQTATIAIDATLAGDNFVNTAEAASFVVSGTTVSVDDGQTVSITLTDGSTTLTTTATVGSGVWTAAAVDISGLVDGSITITADVSDLAGNPATQASTTVTLDQTAPTIGIDALDTLVSATEALTFVVSGETDGVENGQTVYITLSDGVNPDVTATATVASGVWSATVDISSLDDGSITIIADVSDFAGNPAPQTGTTVTLDQTAPTIAIDTLDAFVNGVEASNFLVSGTTSGVENGQTVSITLSHGATTLTASTTVAGGIWAATVDIGSLADGSIAITADVSDLAGNPATQASTTVTLDQTGPTITFGTLDALVNAAEASSFVVSGTTSGVQNGQTISITLADDATTLTASATVAGGHWTTTVDISTLADGTITITANVSDLAGNPGTAGTTVTLDQTAPDIFIDGTLAGNNLVNAVEAASFVVSGTTVGVEDGQTVSITLTDGFTTLTTTATVGSGVWTAPAVDISGLDDGTIAITADVSDLAGNPATQASTTVTLDQTAPTIGIDALDTLVNATEALTFQVSGTTSGVEDGQTVYITLSDGDNPDVTATATVASGAWSATVDISSLDDGTITITADVSDLAGNPATQADTTVTLDQTASIAIDDPLAGDNMLNAVEALSAVVSGTTVGVEDGQTVTVTVTFDTGPVTATATVLNNAWSTDPADISIFGDQILYITAEVTDVAGNPASDSSTVTLDQTAPTINLDTLDALVNATEALTFQVSGTTAGVEDGQTVDITLSNGVNPDVTATATVTSGVWSTPVDISSLDDGTITISADVSDLAGNPATQASTTVTLDKAAPNAPSITSVTDGVTPVTGPLTSGASTNDTDLTVRVSLTGTGAVAGDTVQLYNGTGTTSQLGSSYTLTGTDITTNGYADVQTGTLTDGLTYTITARVTNAVGNQSVVSTNSYTVTIDTVAPNTSIDSNPANPSNSSAAAFTFSSPDGTATFEVSLDSAAFAAATSPQNFTGLSDGSHTFKVRAVDPAGNIDPTPASFTWTIDTLAPDTSIDSNPANPSNSSAAAFTFSSPDGTATFEVRLDSAAFAAATSPQNYTSLSDGSHTFQVRAVDAAGNVDATPASFTWTIDTVAPTAGTVNDGSGTDIDFQASTSTISANWSGFSDSGSGIASYQWAIGTTPGGTQVQAYTSTGITGTGATVTGLGLVQGTTYYVSVKAIDAAGNASGVATSDGVKVVQIQDDFNRADNTNLGTNWSEKLGNLAIQNQVLVAQATGTSVAVFNQTQLKDCSIQAQVTVPANGHAGLVARYSGTGDKNMYMGALVGKSGVYTAQIWLNLNGTWTKLVSQAVTGFTGQGTLKFETIGSSLSLFLNDNLVAQVINRSLLKTGLTGVRGSQNAAFDNFAAYGVSLTGPITDNFDRAALGSNWTPALGTPALQGNQFAPTAAGINLALYNQADPADVTVQAKVNLSTGYNAGLVARYQGTGDTNMYEGLLVNRNGSFFAEIWRNVQGVWTNLTSQAVSSGNGTLRFQVAGNTLDLFLDTGSGFVTVGHKVDNSLSGAGLTGIRSTAGTNVDNFSVQ